MSPDVQEKPGIAVDAPVEDLRVRGITRLITPTQVKEQLPLADAALETVRLGRQTARTILRGEDHRLLVIVGPCSIHDPAAALEYAERLRALSGEVSDRLFLVMRVYFEKPRTTVGWKGLINDPHLDDSCDIAHGILLARELLLRIAGMGLPASTEFLDPIVPQFIADLISWAAIGARTTESQTHREMASGLSMPVGFKNGTDGNIQTAIDALRSSRSPHSFLGIDQDGSTSIIKTAGNPDGHLVLRGGRSGPNYARENVDVAADLLEKAGLRPALMIDCSHANSAKDPSRQPKVFREVVAQREAGQAQIVGAMLESHLYAGNQAPEPDRSKLRYGVSITDGCIDWETTETLLREVAG